MVWPPCVRVYIIFGQQRRLDVPSEFDIHACDARFLPHIQYYPTGDGISGGYHLAMWVENDADIHGFREESRCYRFLWRSRHQANIRLYMFYVFGIVRVFRLDPASPSKPCWRNVQSVRCPFSCGLDWNTVYPLAKTLVRRSGWLDSRSNWILKACGTISMAGLSAGSSFR